jgi:hypothetical protein
MGTLNFPAVDGTARHVYDTYPHFTNHVYATYISVDQWHITVNGVESVADI